MGAITIYVVGSSGNRASKSYNSTTEAIADLILLNKDIGGRIPDDEKIMFCITNKELDEEELNKLMEVIK